MNGMPLTMALVLLAAVQPQRMRPISPHAAQTGTLVVRWTFGGRASPDACDAMRAATVEIDVHDPSARPVATLVAPCAAFAATAALQEGTYSILAVPEDDSGRAVSVPMQDRLAIEAGASRTVSFNFPFSAVAGNRRGTSGLPHP
jgi:hypothetical protein